MTKCQLGGVDHLRVFLDFLVSLQKEMEKLKLRSELPEKEANIHGREKDIDVIVQALLEKNCKTVAGFLVTGTAGVGKSIGGIGSQRMQQRKMAPLLKVPSS